MTERTLAKAINEGLRKAMEADPKVLLLGEDIGKLGGVFRVTDALQKDFGDARVIDSPLGESGIVGTSVGLAIRGYRPVSEIQFDGVVYPAFDQRVSQVAKQHARSEGAIRLPLVVRIPYGGGIGAVEHHSESPEAYFAHTPGLRVVSPSTPNDGYWMVRQSIECDDPVIFLEPKCRYWEKGEVDEASPPAGLFEAAVRREGTDATLVAYGPSVRTCLKAADAAAGEGRSLEVIDLRSISPLDVDAVATSVEKTGRLLIAHEAPTFGGMGAEIAARLTERCFFSLSAPPIRVGGYHTPYPPSRVEEEYLPNVDRLLDALDRAFEF